MRKYLILLFGLLSQIATHAYPYDFEVDGIYYNVLSPVDLTCAVTKGDVEYSGDIVIPSSVTYNNRELSVTKIGESAFRDCSSLTSVTMPSSLTKIGESAFRDCRSLTSVTMPSSLTKIGESAFRDCRSLTSVTMSSSVTEIGYYAFYGCSSLTSVTMSSSVTEIGYCAFYGCSSLTSVTIPSSVTEIGYCAFYGCSSLTSIMIPSSVTEIGSSAFEGCSSLSSVTIPSSVTEIMKSTFSGCSSLTSFTIPSSVTEIGERAFSDCNSLTKITIPNNVDHIYRGAFLGCSELAEVTIGGGIRSIRCYMSSVPPYVPPVFYGCNKIEKLTFLDNETDLKLENSDRDILPFYDLVLSEIYVGRDVYCSNSSYRYYSYKESLNKITFGEHFTGGGFYGNLSSIPTTAEIYCKNPEPPSFGGRFTNKQYITNTVYVPKGALEAYQQADGWKNFWNLKEYDFTAGVEVVSADTADIPSDGLFRVYNLSGILVKTTAEAAEIQELPAGLYIVNGKKVAVK